MAMKPQLTLGPIQFHWPAEQWKDFYFRIADEAPVDTVYIGEVICSKRAPFYEPLYAEVTQRLQKAGKKVVFSTLAEVMIRHDRNMVEGLAATKDMLVEANDASALFHLSGKPHAIGPFLNAYNEDSLALLSRNGATHICFLPELPKAPLAVMAGKAGELGMSTEVQVYGRVPLALSARCYHARAHGRMKDNCQFICEQDADGMELKTLQGRSFLAINGIATMSHTCLNLMQELDELKEMGIDRFRLSPHSHDMVKVAALFRSVLDGSAPTSAAIEQLAQLAPQMPFSNGFYHKRQGYEWLKAAA
jgi:collagenase-like PrtC family protease